MNRIAGMVISEGRAYLAVLANDRPLETDADGKPWAWRVEKSMAFTMPDHSPDCPVILDAAEWNRYPDDPDARWSMMLRSLGWDVRPPMWRDGKACNPDFDDLCGAILECFDDMKDTPTLDAEASQAFRLACWGATHGTTAEPPHFFECAPREFPPDYFRTDRDAPMWRNLGGIKVPRSEAQTLAACEAKATVEPRRVATAPAWVHRSEEIDTRAMLDAAGAVVQEAKHHHAGRGKPLDGPRAEGPHWTPLPLALVGKIAELERVTDPRPLKTALIEDGYKAASDPRAPSWTSGDLSAPIVGDTLTLSPGGTASNPWAMLDEARASLAVAIESKAFWHGEATKFRNKAGALSDFVRVLADGHLAMDATGIPRATPNEGPTPIAPRIEELIRQRLEARKERDAEAAKHGALYNAVEAAINAALGDEWGDAESLPSPHAEARGIAIVAEQRDEAERLLAALYWHTELACNDGCEEPCQHEAARQYCIQRKLFKVMP